MALTNIFREPRREIAETSVGVAVFAALMVPDYYFSVWLALEEKGGIVLGMMLGFFLGVLILMFIVLIHFVGEEICDNLERKGIRLRPRRVVTRRMDPYGTWR